jgi:hypothetical protein
LWFDTAATGQPRDDPSVSHHTNDDDDDEYDDDEDTEEGAQEEDEEDDRREKTKLFRVSFQYDFTHVRTKAMEQLFTSPDYRKKLGPAIPTVEIGDYVRHDTRNSGDNQEKGHRVTEFFDGHGAMVTAVFVDRFPNAGVYTIMLKNHEGISKGVAMSDIVVDELAKASQRVMRYGDEQMILGHLQDKDSTIHRADRNGNTDNTLLHMLFSNPNITLETVKKAHTTIWKNEPQPIHTWKNFSGFTPIHNLCGNIHAPLSVVQYVLTDMWCVPQLPGSLSAFVASSMLSSAAEPSFAMRAHSTDAAAALQAQPGGDEKFAPGGDERDDPKSFPAPSPLHIACRGLPLDVDCLKLLLNTKGTEAWEPHAATLSVDGSNNGQGLESTFSQDSTNGQQPLHTVTLWPHLRISPGGTEALLMACPAVTKMLVRNDSKRNDSKSSPLHQSCDILEYTRTVLENRNSGMEINALAKTAVETTGQHILVQIGEEAETDLKALEAKFERIDADNSKEMTHSEWAKFLAADNFTVDDRTTHSQRSPTRQEISAAWNLLDVDHSGTVTFDEFVRAVKKRKTRSANVEAAQIHVPYLQEREGDMMKVALAMVHQLRGTWSPSQTDALERAGIMEKFIRWIQDLWVPVAKQEVLAVGTFVSLNHTKGMKARVVRDYRAQGRAAGDAVPKVELEEYTVGANIKHADFNAAHYVIDTSGRDRVLKCPLCDFLCESNNAFESIFNLIDFFMSRSRRKQQQPNARRKEYQSIALSLMGQAGRLATWMPVRCINGDQRSYSLSKVLLQPAMLPTLVSNHYDSKWQLTGGIATLKDLLSDGPLDLAVRHDATLFTSSEWVKSYVDRSQFDGIHRGDHLTAADIRTLSQSSTVTTMARNLFWDEPKSLYNGRHIPLVQHTLHEKLTRSGVVDIHESVALLGYAVCGVVSPRCDFS